VPLYSEQKAHSEQGASRTIASVWQEDEYTTRIQTNELRTGLEDMGNTGIGKRTPMDSTHSLEK